MAVSRDDPAWTKKPYAGVEHDSTNQDWQVSSLPGGPVTMRFKEFATKHLLKPSVKGRTALEKAGIIHSKRARTHAMSQDASKGHWQVKYGKATQKNTMIDLNQVSLKTVLEQFAKAILASDSPANPKWKADQSRDIIADFGKPAFIVATDSGVERTTDTKVTFTAKKLGNRSYEIYHLVGTRRR